MKDTNKIKKLAQLKSENPELFEQLVRENYNNNTAWRELIDSLPMEKFAGELSPYTWLDNKLMVENGIQETRLKEMTPAEKIETYLNGEEIFGYTEEIIRAVGDAYGVTLPV